jgi:hypothetical protein
MESMTWRVDWNPDFEDDRFMKREVLRAIKNDKVLQTIRRLADQAVREAKDDDLETEHLVWLDTRGKYAFFIRVWYEASEEKVFIIVEENDLGDVGFLIMENFDCATYSSAGQLKVEFRDPDTFGVEP